MSKEPSMPDPAAEEPAGGQSRDYVSFRIADQLFGIPVLSVQDVLSEHRITRIPLAPAEIAGSLNLRGRIVTAIDVRMKLELPTLDDGKKSMSIVVERGGELYSLLVDSVGEVLSLSEREHERNPPTLDRHLREFSQGIYRLNEKLLVELNVDRLLDYDVNQAA